MLSPLTVISPSFPPQIVGLEPDTVNTGRGGSAKLYVPGSVVEQLFEVTIMEL